MKPINIIFLTFLTLFLSGCGTSASISEADNNTFNNYITNVDAANVDVDSGALVVVQDHIDFHKPVYQFLDDLGNGTGNYSAVGDYSVTSKFFYIQPNATQVMSLNRIIIHYEDTGNFDAGAYGNGITLTNGISAIAKLNNVIYPLFNGETITTNAEWGGYCFDTDYLDFGVGDKIFNVRCTFTKGGQPFILNGSNGDYFGFNLSDSFVGINHQHYHVQGRIVNERIY